MPAAAAVAAVSLASSLPWIFLHEVRGDASRPVAAIGGAVSEVRPAVRSMDSRRPFNTVSPLTTTTSAGQVPRCPSLIEFDAVRRHTPVGHGGHDDVALEQRRLGQRIERRAVSRDAIAIVPRHHKRPLGSDPRQLAACVACRGFAPGMPDPPS